MTRDEIIERARHIARRTPAFARRHAAAIVYPMLPIAIVGLFAARGCEGPHVPHLALPEGATTTASTVVPPPQFDQVALAAVRGTTTTSLYTGAGTSGLKGTVLGPDGLGVPGAVVRIERLVGDQVLRRDIPTSPEGRYEVVDLAGGRYRIRAFYPPSSLTQAEPTLLFITADTKQDLDLPLAFYGGPEIKVAVAPDPPFAREPLSLVIQVGRRSVDIDGIVHTSPASGVLVDLISTGTWSNRGASSEFADTDGRVRFELQCQVEGPNQVQVLVRTSFFDPGVPATLAMPECTDPGAITATTDDGTGSSTTTGRNDDDDND